MDFGHVALSLSMAMLRTVTTMEKSDQMLKNIEQEMECPRCNDIMTLNSDFDKLGYVYHIYKSFTFFQVPNAG